MLLSLAACDKSPETATPGASYDTLKELPDFSGWWIWEYTPADQLPNGAPPVIFLDAPFKPEIAAVVQARIQFIGKLFDQDSGAAAVANDDSYNKANYCSRPKFAGVMGASFNSWFEVLYTPGRVTLIDEEGLIRRVDLDKPLPADVEASNTGTSVGHWEGQTLVVETLRVGRILPPDVPAESGDGRIQVVERYSLKEPDLLQNEVTITAPNVFTRPYEHTYLYRRDRTHEYHDETSCVDFDRYGDPTTGKQRFDSTPPADLPPPPTD